MITILHLSDLQFGHRHRFGRLGLKAGEGSFDTLFARLSTDLETLRDGEGLRPDLLVLTGDLAEHGKKGELDDALVFLEKLTDLLELERRRVVILPGNHDVNRKLCEAYFFTCEGDEEEPVAPYWPKWKHFVQLFDRFYRDVQEVDFAESVPWSLFEIPELRTVVAALNSTIAESHRPEDHYGWLGERQLCWFKKPLREYQERGWLRIGAVHHNLVRGADDEQSLRDRDLLERLLGRHLNLVLHGHTHDSRLHWLNPQVPILSTGSAALVQESRPEEVPNQYQVIQVHGGGLRRWARMYAPDQQRWLGDARVSESGDRWHVEYEVAFADFGDGDVERAPSRRRPAPAGTEPTVDDFLSRVEQICRLREEGATIERVTSGAMDYLSVSVLVHGIARLFPVGAVAGEVDGPTLDTFLAIHRRYQRTDPQVVSVLVYGKPASEDLIHRATAERVRLKSFMEYQGLIDFRGYVERQTVRLSTDPLYKSEFYVPQRIIYKDGLEGDAYETIRDWLKEPHRRFILVLGDFGTGKTFLLHELARRMVQEPGTPTPILIELRTLEKSHSLDKLIAQQLADSGMERIDLKAFRYMLAEGRIALFFDGFDELGLRVSYERAADHLSTLLEASHGEAKVVVTSRSQHFISDRQIKTKLAEATELIAGNRIAYLQLFSEGQIRTYLQKRFDSSEEARKRFQLIAKVKDLLGLSMNPRMLGFIAEVEESKLRAVKRKGGEITAAELYRLLLDRWLGHEMERQELPGGPPSLSVADRWKAVTALALYLWQKAKSTVSLAELGGETARALETLAEGMSPQVATQQMGSGSLLVRIGEGMFSFLHQSVLEWLVAYEGSRQLKHTQRASVFEVREISLLMGEFFINLAGHARAAGWTEEALAGGFGETARKNARHVQELLGQVVRVELAGQDLQGEDFSGKNLNDVDLRGANLSDARLRATRLQWAQLQEAILTGADLTQADLQGADLTNADLEAACLLGADLTGARLVGANLQRARLVGACLAEAAWAEAKTFGAAEPRPRQVEPWLWGSSSRVNAVAWCLGGRALLSGHDDGTVRIWDVATGREIRRLQVRPTSAVLSLAVSPDGKTLAAAARDRAIHLCRLDGDGAHQVLRGHQGSVLCVAFSPDGGCLASASGDQTVRLWSVAEGRSTHTLEGHRDQVRGVVASPQGDRLVSASDDGTLRLWDLADGRPIQVLEGHQDWVLGLAVSRDGKIVASASNDRTLRLWNLEDGRSMQTFKGHQGSVLSVAISPAGDRLASASRDQTVRVWSLDGRCLETLEGHQSPVTSVAFSPRGESVATASFDETVRLWGLAGGARTRTLEGRRSAITSVAVGDHGRILATAADETLRLWRLSDGCQIGRLAGHQGRILAVAGSLQGDLLASASADQTVRLWRIGDGRLLRIFREHQAPVSSVSLSPREDLLASGSRDRTVRLWRLRGEEGVRTLEGHRADVVSVAVAPDGSFLASASRDRTVRLWQVSDGRLVHTLEGHDDTVFSVVFDRRGEVFASASRDGTVRLWRSRDATLLHTLGGQEGPVRCVALSPAGDCLAAAADRTVRLWSLDGRLLRTLEGHPTAVTSLAFNPEGDRLVSAAYDQATRLWDVASGECLATLVALPEGWVALTPRGRYKQGGDTTGFFWHAMGLCRFEPGELDPYLEEPLQVSGSEPLW